MSSSDVYYMNILTNLTIYLYGYALPIFYVIGNVGNLLSAIVFWKKGWRKNVCVFYFNVHLLSNTCYINSFLLGTIFTSGYNINLHNSSVILCKLLYYTGSFFAKMPPTILILASIDRLLISSQNVDTRLYSSRRLGYLLVSTSAFVWSIFCVHILIEFTVVEVYTSVFVCYFPWSEMYFQFLTNSTLAFTIAFCVTMVVLLIVSLKNVRRIRAAPRQEHANQIRVMTKKDFQLLRCLFVQDTVYTVFTIPLSFFYAYKAATNSQEKTIIAQAVLTFLQNAFTLINYIPYCADFFIFFLISKNFRNQVRRAVNKIIGKDAAIKREEEEERRRDHLELNVVQPAVIRP